MAPACDQNPLRITLLNSSDQSGGAETVARALRDGLRAAGDEASLWVGRRNVESEADHTYLIPADERDRERAARYARKGFFGLGLSWSKRFCDSAAVRDADVVHLHNLHGHYFSLSTLPYLARRCPLVWTFHDFFPITGGCAFPFECERWLSKCGSCPQLGRYPLMTPHDRTRRLQSIKRQVFRDLPVTIVTPSEHLGRAVERSGVFERATLRTIPNAVDTERFYPDREAARVALNIRADDPVVLLVAQGLDDPRKGIELGIEALRGMQLGNVTILLVGRDIPDGVTDSVAKHRVRRLGYLSDGTELARYYAAADLLVFPSLAENFPVVTLEAFSCGTPVISFDIAGAREQIDDGKTGLLVPPGDVAALSQAMSLLLSDRARLAGMGAAARRHVEAHFSLDRFVQRHQRLYREVLERRRFPDSVDRSLSAPV